MTAKTGGVKLVINGFLIQYKCYLLFVLYPETDYYVLFLLNVNNSGDTMWHNLPTLTEENTLLFL